MRPCQGCARPGPNPRGERRDGTGDEGGRGWSEIHTYEASSVQISATAKLSLSPGALSSSFHLPRNGCAADILVEFGRGERPERRRKMGLLFASSVGARFSQIKHRERRNMGLGHGTVAYAVEGSLTGPLLYPKAVTVSPIFFSPSTPPP
jgi:hypothetical protein